jgi:hypothetical protein
MHHVLLDRMHEECWRNYRQFLPAAGRISVFRRRHSTAARHGRRLARGTRASASLPQSGQTRIGRGSAGTLPLLVPLRDAAVT